MDRARRKAADRQGHDSPYDMVGRGTPQWRRERPDIDRSGEGVPAPAPATQASPPEAAAARATAGRDA